MYLSPPTGAHGKTLMKSAPAVQAATTSVGVKAPGSTGTFLLVAYSTIAGLKFGEVRKHAPASRVFSAVSTSSTVPAPTAIFPWERQRWAIKSTAPGTIMVISTIGI